MAAIAVVHGVTITSPAKKEDPLQPLCPCSGQETSKQPALSVEGEKGGGTPGLHLHTRAGQPICCQKLGLKDQREAHCRRW